MTHWYEYQKLKTQGSWDSEAWRQRSLKSQSSEDLEVWTLRSLRFRSLETKNCEDSGIWRLWIPVNTGYVGPKSLKIWKRRHENLKTGVGVRRLKGLEIRDSRDSGVWRLKILETLEPVEQKYWDCVLWRWKGVLAEVYNALEDQGNIEI
jgi:hypothetical protein